MFCPVQFIKSLFGHSPRQLMSISKIETESGLSNSTGVQSQIVHLTRVLAKSNIVLHVLSCQRKGYSGSPGIQSELMGSVSNCLCRDAHSSSVPELVIQERSVRKPLMSRLNQQKKPVLTLCCSPVTTSTMSLLRISVG